MLLNRKSKIEELSSPSLSMKKFLFLNLENTASVITVNTKKTSNQWTNCQRKFDGIWQEEAKHGRRKLKK